MNYSNFCIKKTLLYGTNHNQIQKMGDLVLKNLPYNLYMFLRILSQAGDGSVFVSHKKNKIFLFFLFDSPVVRERYRYLGSGEVSVPAPDDISVLVSVLQVAPLKGVDLSF